LKAWRWIAPIVLLLGLGSRGLNEPDEGRYAEMALEMLQSGDWLMPHLNGFAHMQKPPMICWLNALSMAVFGVNEWAVRLPTALSALGVLWMTHLAARRIIGERRAHVVATLLLSCFGLFILARLLTPDMVMTFWICAAVCAMLHDRPWLFFTAMGLGFLTKGPMALVVPICAALGWRWQKRQGLRPWPWGRGALLTLGIALSWFAIVCLRDPELLSYYLNDELIKRVGSSSHGRAKPWWFFLPILVVATLPWSLQLPAAIKACWRALREGARPRQALLSAWVLPPLLVLSLSGSKLPTYALPLLPGLIIALALHEKSWQLTRRCSRASLAIWLTAVAISTQPFTNRWLGAQASVKPLCLQLKALLETHPGEVILCGAKAHGVEFYLRRMVHMIDREADHMLPPTGAAARRLHAREADCVRDFANQQAYLITVPGTFDRHFKPHGWKILGQSGRFLLAANEPSGP
jgi:4-amino-4-deoxy-L-arabinose transferase-like glycosyltransferase